MARKVYIGSSNAKNISAIYVGVGSKTRNVKKAYIGVGGKARVFFGYSMVTTGNEVQVASRGQTNDATWEWRAYRSYYIDSNGKITLDDYDDLWLSGLDGDYSLSGWYQYYNGQPYALTKYNGSSFTFQGVHCTWKVYGKLMTVG